jgi:plastocyanin
MIFSKTNSGRRALHAAALGLLLAASFTAHAANGCFANFTDLRGRSLVTIRAPLCQVLDYQPRCARVSAGTTVRFDMSFSCHPTFGGTVVDNEAEMDPTSPIGPWGSGGPYDVTFANVGEYPYFCDFHYMMGMTGSILVVPELFADGFEQAAAP